MENVKNVDIVQSDFVLPTISQQELETLVGIERHIMCAPAALLTAANQAGYNIDPSKIADWIDWSQWHESNGWSRPGLTGILRGRYGVSIVSWWSKSTGQNFAESDIKQMQTSGYIKTAVESDFLKDVVSHLPQGTEGIMALVEEGCPITVTVKPGFGMNKVEHAIILQGHDTENATISFYDPDQRNTSSVCSEEYIREYLSSVGACTVVLPI